jgi:outer membrane receptor protein involved in Fe transport
MRGAALLLPMLAAVASPAMAREHVVDVAGGRLEDVAVAVARQTGSSIVITDRDLAGRVVGAIRGRMSAREASEALARAAGARAIPAGANGWRLVRAAPVVRTAARPASPPPAPPPQAVASEPIIVLGSKRDMSLRDYAGQVNQIDGAELTFGGVGGTERIAARVASVSTTHLGSGRNKLFIRGIADSSFTGPTQSTVGQYLGDLRLSYNAPDPDLRLSDLASVEVLEGPQGTLYGAGSLGGIVRLVPNPPDPGAVLAAGMVGGSLTLHGKPGADASAMVNLPVAEDRVALRVSADGEIQGGYIDKPLLGRDDVNRTLIGSVRASTRFDLDNGWLVDLTGVIQHTKGDDSQYADRIGSPLTRSAQVTEGYEADYRQAQLVLAGQLGAVRVRSTTGYATQALSERYDATLPLSPTRLFVQRNNTRMVANETRAWVPLGDRTGWVLGTSYTHNRTRLRRELGEIDAPLASSTGVSNAIEEFTIYGEGSLRVANGLIATAGGRLTWSAISGEGEDVLADVAASKAAVTADRNEKMFLPSLALTAQPLPDTSLYLRYQEGFRPGGLAIDGDFVRRFRNDHISAIEFGLRHGHARRGVFDLAVSVSYTSWRDIQADYIDPTGLPTTANVGDGRIWTLSIAGGVRPSPGLRIDAGLVYNNSRITQPNLYLLFPALALGPITEVPNVAKLAARFGIDYRHTLGNDLELRAQGWARYVGRSRLGVGPELGDLQGDYLESGTTIRIGRDGLGATLGVTNLLDTAGNRFSLGTPFAVGREQITPLRPLTVRLGIDAAF